MRGDVLVRDGLYRYVRINVVSRPAGDRCGAHLLT
jgi:hypothetical protein